MQVQLSEQYSASEIYEARDEIFELQQNLNLIEQLYCHLYSTLDYQQPHIEDIETSIYHTQTNLEKGDADFYQILQSRRKKDQQRCCFSIFICIIVRVFLVIVLNVLINVIKTFGFERIDKSRGNR